MSTLLVESCLYCRSISYDCQCNCTSDVCGVTSTDEQQREREAERNRTWATEAEKRSKRREGWLMPPPQCRGIYMEQSFPGNSFHLDSICPPGDLSPDQSVLSPSTRQKHVEEPGRSSPSKAQSWGCKTLKMVMLHPLPQPISMHFSG